MNWSGKIKRTFLYHKLRHLYKTDEEKRLLSSRLNMYKDFVKKGDLIFDVGANVGNRIEAFLALKARVIAVEPQRYCRKILRAKFGRSINIIPQGLGEREEVKTMYISSANTLSSFSKDWIDAVKKERFKEFEWEKSEQIEITTLENLINTFGVPTFIKIDVEGFEFEVLKGLKTSVHAISFEYTVPEQLNNVLSCLDKINALSGRYHYNYSVGESMQLELDNYSDYENFKNLISMDKFANTEFGDIYAKMI